MWRLFNLLTLLSLLLALILGGLWAHSRTHIHRLVLRSAPSYTGWPGVKWVELNTFGGWRVDFKSKVEPYVHGVQTPWRDDVPISAKQLLSPRDDDARPMTDAERAAYDAETGPKYAAMPRLRYEIHRESPGVSRSPNRDGTLWRRLGFTRYASNDYRIDSHYDTDYFPGTYHEVSYIAPWWSVFSLAAVLPVAWAGARLRQYVKGRRVGRCPECGYDLRGSPERCPECGRHVTDAEAKRAGFARPPRPDTGAKSWRLLPALRRRWDLVAFTAIVALLGFGLYSGRVASREAPSVDLRWARGELDAAFAELAEDSARLRAAGDTAAADRLEADLRRLRDPAAWDATGGDDDLEVDVVGLGGGVAPDGPPREVEGRWVGTAVVEVRPTGRPVVLALSGDEPLEWELRVAPGARLRRVLLGGLHHQEVRGVPAGVAIEDHSNSSGSPTSFHVMRRDGFGYAGMLDALRTITGKTVTTFQGRYGYKGRPIIVGRGGREWEAQRLLAALEPLRQAAWERHWEHAERAGVRDF